ncbi:hypothetical protein VE02_05880 [Pseudogymnoascus sp. 03VT05]|nr:hypothetical protein VE02_05880 [Pseudogymnoascus sp. 03VT05]
MLLNNARSRSSSLLFLQNLHSRHIEKELPMVRREIIALSTEIEGILTNLESERQTPVDIRMFLTRLSMKFHSLTQAAIDGNHHWTVGDFFAGSSERHLMKLCSDSEAAVGSEPDIDSEEEGEILRVAKQDPKNTPLSDSP